MTLVHRILFFGLLLGLCLRLRADAPAPLRGDFDDAVLREWVQPEYPKAAREAKLEGEVVVEFVVEEDGRVSLASVKKSSDERFAASALAAVRGWQFSSATVDGKPAASGMQVKVVFALAQLQQKSMPALPPRNLLPVPLPVVPAKLTASPPPDYPAELEDRRLAGQVVLEFPVGSDGKPGLPKVLWASHAAFVAEALRTLPKYRFEPAHQGPLPVRSNSIQGQMDFDSVGATPLELLAINHLELMEPEKFSVPPKPAVLPEPVYPRDLLMAGEEGSASVAFNVSDRGAVADVLLQEASRPEFGAALVAAVQTWRFEAALHSHTPAAAHLIATCKFALPEKGAVNRLVLALRPGGEGVGGAGGLDERLQPLWRISPVYPQALLTGKPAGKAVIEFIIDREGRARLPHVVSASQDEFGWAAAAAISQWVFAPPLRGGQSVDVKVSVPVNFPPPTD